MSTVSAIPVRPASSREGLEARLREILPGSGPGRETAIRLILAAADAYAAHLVEQCARPDDRWGPV